MYMQLDIRKRFDERAVPGAPRLDPGTFNPVNVKLVGNEATIVSREKHEDKRVGKRDTRKGNSVSGITRKKRARKGWEEREREKRKERAKRRCVPKTITCCTRRHEARKTPLASSLQLTPLTFRPCVKPNFSRHRVKPKNFSMSDTRYPDIHDIELSATFHRTGFRIFYFLLADAFPR